MADGSGCSSGTPPDQWVVSERLAHRPLVSEADFVAVQAVRSTRAAGDAKPRIYRLAGLRRCGLCGRRLDSHWVNDRPGYRCRHGFNCASPITDRHDRERVIYVREDELLHDLASTLRQANGQQPAPDEVPALLRRATPWSSAVTPTEQCAPPALTTGVHRRPWGNCVSET
jgi:site-specific DNA recombinase